MQPLNSSNHRQASNHATTGNHSTGAATSNHWQPLNTSNHMQPQGTTCNQLTNHGHTRASTGNHQPLNPGSFDDTADDADFLVRQAPRTRLRSNVRGTSSQIPKTTRATFNSGLRSTAVTLGLLTLVSHSLLSPAC